MEEKCEPISVSSRLVLVLHDQAELDQTLKTSGSWTYLSWNIPNSECWRGSRIWFFGFSWEPVFRRMMSEFARFSSWEITTRAPMCPHTPLWHSHIISDNSWHVHVDFSWVLVEYSEFRGSLILETRHKSTTEPLTRCIHWFLSICS